MSKTLIRALRCLPSLQIEVALFFFFCGEGPFYNMGGEVADAIGQAVWYSTQSEWLWFAVAKICCKAQEILPAGGRASWIWSASLHDRDAGYEHEAEENTHRNGFSTWEEQRR